MAGRTYSASNKISDSSGLPFTITLHDTNAPAVPTR